MSLSKGHHFSDFPDHVFIMPSWVILSIIIGISWRIIGMVPNIIITLINLHLKAKDGVKTFQHIRVL